MANICLVVIALSAVLAVTGCSKSEGHPTPETIVATASPSAGPTDVKQAAPRAPALVVAIEGNSPPFNVMNAGGVLVGFDVDVATAVAKRLGRPIRIEPTPMEHAPRVLKGRERDLIVSALSVVNDADVRLKDIDLSNVYYESTQVVVVRGGDKEVDLKKMTQRIAVTVASPADSAISALLGQRDSRIARYASPVLALQDLEAGAVGAAVLERGTVLNYLISSPKTELQLARDPSFAPPPERYHMAVRKGDQHLLGQVNQALHDIKSDGTYDAIYARYFGPSTK